MPADQKECNWFDMCGRNWWSLVFGVHAKVTFYRVDMLFGVFNSARLFWTLFFRLRFRKGFCKQKYRSWVHLSSSFTFFPNFVCVLFHGEIKAATKSKRQPETG
jgi:hypothetical protein